MIILIKCVSRMAGSVEKTNMVYEYLATEFIADDKSTSCSNSRIIHKIIQKNVEEEAADPFVG